MRHAARALIAVATAATVIHVALLALLQFGRFDASDELTPKGPTR